MAITPYRRKAQYYETDQMGIIHHSNYIRWFEEARVHFMEQVGYGYDDAVESGIDFAVTGLECHYKSMVRFGESVDIVVSVSHISQSRMSVQYEVLDSQTQQLRCTGKTHHCYFDNQKQRPVSLKKTMPELYDLFLSLCTDIASI